MIYIANFHGRMKTELDMVSRYGSATKICVTLEEGFNLLEPEYLFV